jgi:hypothetical protein
MDYRKRNWYLVLGGIIAYTAVIGGLSLALAIRDAEHAGISSSNGSERGWLFSSPPPALSGWRALRS